jgi:predicted nucleic acid-binding protein
LWTVLPYVAASKLGADGEGFAVGRPGIRKARRREGEAITIVLAHQSDALLLIDEGRGRRQAEQRKIRFMGTLGVLDKAAARGLIDLHSAIEHLLQTNFYVTPSLLKTLLENDANRKKSASPQR